MRVPVCGRFYPNEGGLSPLRQPNEGKIYRKVGLGISKEHLEADAYQVYDTVFLLLEPEDRYQGITEELPGQTCVSIRFCGSHNEAPAYYQKLLTYIREHRLKIDGFSREVTMIDYVLTNDPKQFVTEIQIPVCEG